MLLTVGPIMIDLLFIALTAGAASNRVYRLATGRGPPVNGGELW